MPYTVAVSFDQFYSSINLSGDHRKTANKRRDRLVSLLGNHFDILEAFPSGSVSRFTALSGHADVDVMVALHFGKHIKGKTPDQILKSVRDALGEYETGVRRNGQAVTLKYKTWPDVDIVPASRVSDNGRVLGYEIPNSNTGNWISTNPKVHSADVEAASRLRGPNFRKAIKMVKWWNKAHSDYMQSYHIEVVALHAWSYEIDDLSWALTRWFDQAVELVQSPLFHDRGIVDGYLTYNSRQELLKRLETAKTLAQSAWFATYGENDDHKTAITKWRQLFGGYPFPEYG
jgi:SMODS domain-containing protein